MLDYTILSKEDKGFTKNIEKFDVRETVDEIIEIQQDQIEMKNIHVERHFKGFTNYRVSSDVKRI